MRISDWSSDVCSSDLIIRFVSDRAAAGLEPAQPPRLDDVPNNHFAYAIQWFLFAGVAVAIYILALRGRSRPACIQLKRLPLLTEPPHAQRHALHHHQGRVGGPGVSWRTAKGGG